MSSAASRAGRKGRHLVLNGHIDVFPGRPAETWSRDPWSGAVADGKVHGRGVADMKCGTSASIWTYIYLHRLREELGGRLTLTCVSDEETGGTWGAKWLVDTFPRSSAAIACSMASRACRPWSASARKARCASWSRSTRPARTPPTPMPARTRSASLPT